MEDSPQGTAGPGVNNVQSVANQNLPETHYHGAPSGIDYAGTGMNIKAMRMNRRFDTRQMRIGNSQELKWFRTTNGLNAHTFDSVMSFARRGLTDAEMIGAQQGVITGVRGINPLVIIGIIIAIILMKD